MSTIYMETTSIDPIRTSGEICSILVRAGATQINQQFENQKISGLRWCMKVNGAECLFTMPVRVDPVYKILKRKKPNSSGLLEQAERVAWRQLLRWVQAQLAMIDTGMVEAGEVFSPYMHVADNKTVWQALMEGSRFKLLTEAKQ